MKIERKGKDIVFKGGVFGFVEKNYDAHAVRHTEDIDDITSEIQKKWYFSIHTKLSVIDIPMNTKTDAEETAKKFSQLKED